MPTEAASNAATPVAERHSTVTISTRLGVVPPWLAQDVNVPDFSEFIVYVDESGDHGLATVDPQSPMFVLACCVFQKVNYAEVICPQLRRMKFDYFGHDMVVLHERDIRKTVGPYRVLLDKQVGQRFLTDLNGIMAGAAFTLITSAIDKQRLVGAQKSENPYHLALAGCLDRLMQFLVEHGQAERMTHVVFESRGKREDGELELEFRRICDGANRTMARLLLDIVVASKHANAAGLQLADLVARPVARHCLNPAQPNRAWDIVAPKLYRQKGASDALGLIQMP